MDEEIKSGWRKGVFGATVIAVLLLSLTGSAVFNYIVDPFAIYGTNLYPAITFNKYQNKLYLLRNCQPPPGVLIIGSSRVQCIDPD